VAPGAGQTRVRGTGITRAITLSMRLFPRWPSVPVELAAPTPAGIVPVGLAAPTPAEIQSDVHVEASEIRVVDTFPTLESAVTASGLLHGGRPRKGVRRITLY